MRHIRQDLPQGTVVIMDLNQRIRTAKIIREAEGYLELGLPQQAVNTLSRLGEPEQFGPEVLYLWGESLRALERYAEAIPPLERAAKSAPKDIRVRLALGWCCKRIGRLDRAIQALKEALSLEPNEALLYYNLACYLCLSGQKHDALLHLAKALTLDSAYREAAKQEEDFEQLRNDPVFQNLCAGKKPRRPARP